MNSTRTVKHLSIIALAFIGLLASSMVFSTPEVYAHYDTFRSEGYDDGCGIFSNDSHDFAGLMVQTRVRHPDGSYSNAYGGNSKVRIKTTGIITSPPGGVVQTEDGYDNKHDVEDRRKAVDFKPERSHTYKGDNCDIGGKPFVHMSGVVLGHRRTSEGSNDFGASGRHWKLDCDRHLAEIWGDGTGRIDHTTPNEQQFHVRGAGVPQGVRSGGSWSGGGYIRPKNGKTEKMILTYHEPEQWDLKPRMRDGSAKDGGTVHPGQNYTFRARAVNGGPNDSHKDADLQIHASEGRNRINPAARDKNWENIGSLSAGEDRIYTHGFRVNNNAPDGQRICFYTQVNRFKRGKGENNWRYSPPNYGNRKTRCVTVRYEWRLVARMLDGDGRGAASDGGVVTASPGIGNVYEFKAFTQNNGQDPSPPNTVAGFDNTDMELHTSDGANAITPGSRDRIWNNIGPVQPGLSGRVTRDHQFRVEYYSDARNDGERVCFYSRAHPKDRSSNSNNWAYSPPNYGRNGAGDPITRCVRVQYPYTIEGELDAPDGGDGYLEPGETHTVKAIYRNTDSGDTRTGFDNNVTSLNIEWKALPPSSSGTTRDPSKIIEVKPSYPHYQTSTSWQKTHNSNMNPDDSSRENTLSGKFRVKDTARPDDRVCFQGFYSPSKYRPPGSPFDTFETPVTNATCIKVDVQRKPYLATSEGDVHAGAETCSEPYLHVPGSSKHQPFRVIGRTKGSNGSKATYVTSASGDVHQYGSGLTSFGSNGQITSPSGKRLTFGNTGPLGNYGLICHVDAFSRNFSNADGSFGGNINQGTIGSNPSGIYRKSSASVTTITKGAVTAPLNIPANKSLTFVVDGSVQINTNIEYASGGYQVDQMPGLAIVASGDIYIHPDVTRLDGIYYANQNLNTCSTGGLNNPDISTNKNTAHKCETQLEVNGSLLANEFQFRRTIDDVNNSSPKPALQVNLLPQHLVAPPPGFSGSFESNIRYLGERPPAF